MITRKLFKRRYVLAIAAFVILSFLTLSYLFVYATMPWLLLGPATKDMTPICLKSSSIAGIQWLSIPKAYLPDASDRHSGDMKGITLEFNYKDINPWSLVPADTPKYPVRTPQDDIGNQDNFAELLLWSVKRVAEPYEPLKLPKYTPAPSPFPGWKRVNENDELGTTLDYPDPTTKPPYQYIECTDYVAHPPGLCTAVKSYRGLLLHFYFSSAHLQHVDYYDRRIQDLIDRFLVPEPCDK